MDIFTGTEKLMGSDLEMSTNLQKQLAALLVMDENEICISSKLDYCDRLTKWENEHFDEMMEPKSFPVPPCPSEIPQKEWYRQEVVRLVLEINGR